MKPTSSRTSSPRTLHLLSLAAVLCGVTGCSGIHESADFERHRHSQLVQPLTRPGVIFFDVRFSPAWPEDDPKAETARAEWLATSMKQRGLCMHGHEVVERRPFDWLEDNPAGYDERWEIRCRESD